VGACVAAFIGGVVLTGAVSYLYIRRQRRRVPCTAHYISSNQNPCIAVSLNEVASHHTIRAPSLSSSTSSSNGTGPASHKSSNGGTGVSLGTPKLFAEPLVEYETATIEMNSQI
jgi:hypothetical protein